MKTIISLSALLICTFLFYDGAEASAKQCYFCNGKCSDPMKVQNCTLSEADTNKYNCIQQLVEDADIRSCVPDTVEVKTGCEITDDADGASCSICDTDLCNSGEMYAFTLLLLSVMIILCKIA